MKFKDVIKYLVFAVEEDYKESPYVSFSRYWNDMWPYWKTVFSEDAFKEVENRLRYLHLDFPT
jgi:hypothetical protein